jgi:Ca-activated chloride channel family protein
MTNPAFNPEDPRLTAFVLGEIDDSDRAEIEQLLETSPEAQAAVKEIEETIGVLKEGLASEPTPELTAEQRATVEEQLAGATVASAAEATPQRPSARFGKLAGTIASVAALGLVVTLAVPQLEPAREALMAPLNQLTAEPSGTADMVAMDDLADDGDGREIKFASESSKRLGSFGEPEYLPVENLVADAGRVLIELTPESTPAQPGSSGARVRGSSAFGASNEGRSVSNFEKRDGAKRGLATLGEKVVDYDRSSPAKDSNGSQVKQRLVADTGSRPQSTRPQSASSRQGGFLGGAGGRPAQSSTRPVAAPMAESEVSKAGAGSADSPQSVGRSTKGFRPPPPASVSGGRGANNVSLSNQLGGATGSKSVNGPRVAEPQPGNSKPAKPHTREAIVRNKTLVAPANPSAPFSVDKNKGRLSGSTSKGGIADATAPTSKPATAFDVAGSGVKGPRPDGDSAADRAMRGSTVANRKLADELQKQIQQVELTKGLSQKEKAQRQVALVKAAERESKIKEASGRGFQRVQVGGDGEAAGKNSAAMKAYRESYAALVKGKKISELAEQIREEQTHLAAIDSGATRRVSGRGFGLEGRDLQTQLQQYSESLSLARTSKERVSEAKLQTFGFGNETYEAIVENNFIVPVVGDKEKSLSTISIDVDTASYANMRRFLSRDQLPPANSVRIEELVNYFKYDYPEPEGNDPFSVTTELASCPWQPSHRLAMVGLKARTIDKAQRPPTNLVFLLDVSGSMRASNKLPLVQQSMRLLVEEMTEDDRVSIVTYASNAGVRMKSTLGSKKQEILAAINGLRAGGSTNGEGGIRMAYDEANRHYFQGGANRVILCSDGDFNVGKSSDGELVELIQEKAASGVFLSVFGFGMGNLKDAKLEKLADKGNGHYGYIDNLNEAKKVFQDELVGTLYTVAKDVKLQVEFNPATVGAYRLIGYENRKLAAQDFTDDTKDAGEIGSGHTVTALYEIIPKHVLLAEPSVDGLKYQATAKNPADEGARKAAGDTPAKETVDLVKTQPVDQELMTVKLRYKKPDEEVSQPVQQDFLVKDVSIAGKQISAVSDDLMFAASVASFGMNLRGSKYRGNWGFAEVLETAQGAQGEGNNAQRTEFIQLVQRAMRITGQQTGPQPRTNQGTTTRPSELAGVQARVKASVEGKYRRLVKKIEVRDDFQRFGAFNDYGHWDGTEYSGHKDLPPGNWVYVYPNWYIWAEAVVPAAESAAPKAEPAAPKAEDKPAVK